KYNSARVLLEPLEVEAVFHCGQLRDIDKRRNVDTLARIYRVDPYVPGFLTITWDYTKKVWAVESTLPPDLSGLPLVDTRELLKAIGGCVNWTDMERYLATYFSCNIYEFHTQSPSRRRLKAKPLLVDH